MNIDFDGKTLSDEHIFFRSAGSVNPVVDRAEGIYLYDVDGKRYIDGMGGVGVVSIGHNVPEIRDAAVAQMEKVCFAHPFHWKNMPHMELTERIARFAPEGMTKVFLCSGGSEANESAIKLARQYHVERGNTSKYKVISRWNSFHGNTIGTLASGGMRVRRDLFTPLLTDMPHIASCNCYHCPFGLEYPSCKIRCAHDLEAEILRTGPDNIAAFIAEPVVGAAGGGLIAPPEYYGIIREICDRYDILMIMDEVITGFGRTGKNFGIEHWGVTPDIICTGKGLSSGYTPLGAMIVHERVFEPFKSGRGFAHGYTFGGNPLSCAIGEAVLKYMEEHQLVGNVAALEGRFFEMGRELLELDIVGDVRGKGFFMGLEFVEDKSSRSPFAPSLNVAGRIADRCFKNGLIVGAGKGSIDGVNGDHINLAPPFTCTEADLAEIIAILRSSIEEVRHEL
ncbi:aspartate aminotransferase family protein [Paracoccus sulfuroxidans]|uniref:Adenosylmethionine-8-amino-7-oxononanoate aminotransferase n=1 Tax=Paracoccus sulfuroxidans TaxID=384678 RepID=A0A562NUZ3_9RHOB|nr:aspartate aminotransferase family protein [Paracoccus sulfuroxidans]TWI35985.1 adenosylmethionine-8-amino-7-oxononanoate aminotransferase [Paracoccus sulfuroxidans]